MSRRDACRLHLHFLSCFPTSSTSRLLLRDCNIQPRFPIHLPTDLSLLTAHLFHGCHQRIFHAHRRQARLSVCGNLTKARVWNRPWRSPPWNISRRYFPLRIVKFCKLYSHHVNGLVLNCPRESVLHGTNDDLSQAVDKLIEMCKSQSPVDKLPPRLLGLHLSAHDSTPGTPALFRTLSTASSSSSSSEEDNTLPTPLFDEAAADSFLNFSPPTASTLLRPISRMPSEDHAEVADATFDSTVGGFRVPSTTAKGCSHGDAPGWTPHSPLGQPLR